MTNLGSLSYQKVCSVKIQTRWRGYFARKNFFHLLKKYYKDGNGIESRRKQFFEKEFFSYNEKFDKTMNSRSNQVNSLLRFVHVLNLNLFCPNLTNSFRSMDRTILESRQLDLLFDQMLAARTGAPGAFQETSSAVPPIVPSADDSAYQTFNSSDLSQTPLLNPSEYMSAQKCTWKGNIFSDLLLLFDLHAMVRYCKSSCLAWCL
jgi:hypothetical protein